MLRSLIKEARIQQGATIRQVALYCRISSSTLSRFEAGKTDLTAEHLMRVLLYLGFELKHPGNSEDRMKVKPKSS